MSIELLSRCINAAHAANTARQFDTAIDWCQKGLQLDPERPEIWFNLGLAHTGKNNTAKAVHALLKTASLLPGDADAQNTVGLQLMELEADAEAMHCLKRAIALAPDFMFAHFNLGGLYMKRFRPIEAVACFRKVVELAPGLPDAHYHLGNALFDLKQPREALAAFERVHALKPDYKYIYGHILNLKRQMCDWLNDEQSLAEAEQRVEKGELVCAPFVYLGLVDSPLHQRQVAESTTQADYPENLRLGPVPERTQSDRIRIGYFSADFYNHATAYLMAGLFEMHDREKFELIGFSFGPVKQDQMRQRIEAAFDRFIDVGNMPDTAIAQLSRDIGIDIAIDLKGHTLGARPGIFACRAAPIQVNYLGYPGTMGASYYDYLVADDTVISSAHLAAYSEKIVYLPGCYQVNDASRTIADRDFSRAELGLPPEGFVFCCFNNNYKITPAVFSVWMEILRQTDSSVLWLLADNTEAKTNLYKEAARYGLSADRLIFADRMPLAEHLARHRAADLFLDTLPYNAHTTASDALWAGVPVLTLMGQSFASRVASSLLKAVGLPELITESSQAYQALAIELATHPEKMSALKTKLAKNRHNSPLFDTQNFASKIEASYVAMYERYRDGLEPDHITVEG